MSLPNKAGVTRNQHHLCKHFRVRVQLTYTMQISDDDCIGGKNGMILEILLIVIYIYIMIQTAKLSLCLSSAIISGGKVQ